MRYQDKPGDWRWCAHNVFASIFSCARYMMFRIYCLYNHAHTLNILDAVSAFWISQVCFFFARRIPWLNWKQKLWCWFLVLGDCEEEYGVSFPMGWLFLFFVWQPHEQNSRVAPPLAKKMDLKNAFYPLERLCLLWVGHTKPFMKPVYHV